MSKSRKQQIENIVKNAIFISDSASAYHDWSGSQYYYKALIDRPNILVKLYDIKCHKEFWLGWSKVNWPDRWSERYGINVALRKAAATMIKNGSLEAI